jgi:hypothetical protein
VAHLSGMKWGYKGTPNPLEFSGAGHPAGPGGEDGDGRRISSGPKPQGTRMLKLVCPEDGYTVRTTAKWLGPARGHDSVCERVTHA